MRIIYAAPEITVPVGGVRVLARHVELLARSGYEAALWFQTPGYRFPFFDYDGPAVAGAEVDLAADDLLVLPEVGIMPGIDPAPGARKVIFNQNHFHMFTTWESDSDYPGWDPAPSVWAVSLESAEVLSRIVPGLPVALVPNSVDTELFRPGDRREWTVALMPRKRRQEMSLLKRLLRNDPRVSVRKLAGVPEREVAQVLGETSVFVALGAFESFGLPVAEALASGCHVVGYPAGGGVDLFTAPGTFEVPDARPALLADEVIRVLGAPDARVRAESRAWIEQHHSFEVAREALVKAVEGALARPGAAARATHPMAAMTEFVAKVHAARPT
ncbi:glycosyltransferase [Allokutzneria albata]|uniref:Glycosyl transferases group 1 n=1 Tax=Allokutzneria albata TaxID=211114 RepID=A0A1G9U2D2_ALLAB|nr:glycosyltransferase [Allokutzneria albata]SDM54078.1 Glycosyl transferases group 1 [Allokutzneria albata]